MSDNKVKLGDGLADGVKSQVNQVHIPPHQPRLHG